MSGVCDAADHFGWWTYYTDFSIIPDISASSRPDPRRVSKSVSRQRTAQELEWLLSAYSHVVPSLFLSAQTASPPPLCRRSYRWRHDSLISSQHIYVQYSAHKQSLLTCTHCDCRSNLHATPKTAVNCRKLTWALLVSCPSMTPLHLILGEACKWKCYELYKCKSG